ncbi:RNA-guided endonuclease InsQ/TnpB family protein [Gloeothece verrucosa]|uniref:Transposase, IS605 OrfB family n=1 Tax=Gloeothece verrucosa (strain PCC 7822) TaxID=497965 RepID=E0U5L1_GLOV7|nr:RNA-guided endonuclease TnpB family protein [Gloeothece verrucosa]ADN14724.1 transposase, IS605 OrfB family [Gloeothece verrucosa PCC 7822]
MQLVERHIIKPGHKYYHEADRLCFLAKNLYNCANYIYRQNFFRGVGTNAIEVYHQLKTCPDYQALPAKVAQNVLRLVLKNWISYYQALKAYEITPEKFLGKPKIPRYRGTISLNREDGRYVVGYNHQAISKKFFKKKIAHPSGTNIYLPTKASSIDEIRIVPRTGCYVIEVVYPVEEGSQPAKCKNPQRIAAIDLGLNNLATMTYNVPGLKPVIYDGRAIKSANQYANKKNAQLRSLLPSNQYRSKRLDALWLKRNLKVEYYLHTTSRAIINDLVANQIGVLVIGWNQGFKDSINLGRVSNQKFVSIPHKKLIEQLQYKGSLLGIEVVLTEEAYTSKCSALDNEPIKKHSIYKGKRVHRGLFRTATGKKINADINGSLNIGRLYEQVVGNGHRPHPIEEPVRWAGSPT